MYHLCIYYSGAYIYNIFILYTHACIYYPARNLDSAINFLFVGCGYLFGLWPRPGPPREGSWAKLRNFNVLCFVFFDGRGTQRHMGVSRNGA